MFELLIGLILLVVIAVLVIAVILLLSNLGAYFTKIAQGTTAFITAGESLQEIVPNIGGYKMSEAVDLEGQRWLVPAKDEKEQIIALFRDAMFGTVWFQKLLWKKFGVKFISLFWPHTRIHEFDIRKGGRRRIEARNEVGADAPLRSRVIDSPVKETVVDSLLFLAPRPVYMEGVELAGDNSKINLLLLPVFRQVIPSLPVFNLKGDFFTLLDAAIEAAVVDFFAKHRVAVYKGEKDDPRKGQLAGDSYDPAQAAQQEESPLTYAHWLKLTKAGEGSPLEKRLRHLNVSREYVKKLADKQKAELVAYIKSDLVHADDAADIPVGNVAQMIPSGIVPRFGYALVSFRIVEWEPHKSTEPLAKALLAKETELHAAEGVRQKSLGERDSKVANATGDSSLVTQVMDAFTKHNVDANVAAGVLETMVRTKNIGGSQITTYVEGGASASVMVPTSPSVSTKKETA
ncbi:MAG: hypothetical protein WCT41_03160 [Candidatus Paceibacterota bacterium]|jgi:hypothetical protein